MRVGTILMCVPQHARENGPHLAALAHKFVSDALVPSGNDARLLHEVAELPAQGFPHPVIYPPGRVFLEVRT